MIHKKCYSRQTDCVNHFCLLFSASDLYTMSVFCTPLAPSCPQNSHYTTCIPACSPTCVHLNGPPHCSDSVGCVQGCVCNEGFVQSGSVCVPIQQCGCVERNGARRQVSDDAESLFIDAANPYMGFFFQIQITVYLKSEYDSLFLFSVQ